MKQAHGFAVAVATATLLMGAPAARASGGTTVHCGDTLTHSTKLTRDLSCPGTAPFALRIAGEGIVLDLGGHTIRRTGPENLESVGITVDTNSMVRNGTIQGFGKGVATTESSDVRNLRLHQLALLDNRAAIFNGVVDMRFLITECRLTGNLVGLDGEPDGSTGSFDVRSSVFTHNEVAMYVDFHDIDVLDSTFTSNELAVFCRQGRVRFRSSTLAWNASVSTIPNDNGFRQCDEMRFENTLISNNTALAPPEVPVWQPQKLSMLDSLVVSNGAGLQAAADTVYIHGNTFFDNADGLSLTGRDWQVPVVLTGIIRGNQFLSNDGDGLRVEAPGKPTVLNNVALGNTGFGLFAPTAFDGGGNVARDNGAGNCVGLVCAPY
ncbi:right-handed parallel beta-helix repeat-containing protein [Corallococcus sp. AB045]|nr:right-handed parallel beta-helix repeat-containing protein [Corallococcus sp. AB045]RKH91136.1 right-handed parallel beta-helix repeat-containing protein [Corallococcus sp. AB045]